MYDEYKKDYIITEKNQEQKEIELINTITKTKKELENSIKNFEYAEDGLIDYYLYQIKANQSKLDYLYKKAKKSGIILNMIDDIKLKLYYNEKVV